MTTERPPTSTTAAAVLAVALLQHERFHSLHSMAGTCAQDILAALPPEVRERVEAALVEPEHTQDCINAFHGDGGQSGCICGADSQPPNQPQSLDAAWEKAEEYYGGTLSS